MEWNDLPSHKQLRFYCLGCLRAVSLVRMLWHGEGDVTQLVQV